MKTEAAKGEHMSEKMDLSKCALVPRDPETGEYILACGPAHLKPTALETLDKMAALKRRGLSICEHCAKGDTPEWSERAHVWIHRLEGLDRRCYERKAGR